MMDGTSQNHVLFRILVADNGFSLIKHMACPLHLYNSSQPAAYLSAHKEHNSAVFVCTECSVLWSSLTAPLQSRHTQFFHILMLQCLSVVRWGQCPSTLIQRHWCKHGAWGLAYGARKTAVTLQADSGIFNQWAVGETESVVKISGLGCTSSFIFMPLVNLPIYSRGTQRSSLWLTYCSVLGNMGPEEWELAYSCLIDVNKKCRISFLFSFFSPCPTWRCKASHNVQLIWLKGSG